MDSSQVASALGISGTVLAVLTAVALAVARGLRSRCILFGTVVEMHPATQAEMAAEAQQQQDAQPQHVTVNVQNTPVAPHEESTQHAAPPHIKAPRHSHVIAI